VQELTCASKTFVTTDAVTEALLDLVTAIDRRDHSEAVTVPAFTEDGARVEARMTLDASSELVAVPVDLAISADVETDDALVAAVDDIRSRIRQNQDAVVHPSIEENPTVDGGCSDY
jgi:hypothetical protein